jgi:hypothetical protein
MGSVLPPTRHDPRYVIRLGRGYVRWNADATHFDVVEDVREASHYHTSANAMLMRPYHPANNGIPSAKRMGVAVLDMSMLPRLPKPGHMWR